MIRINLLSEGRRPTAVRKSRTASLAERDWTNLLLLGGILFGVLVTGVYWLYLDRQKSGVQEEVAVAEEEVERLKPILEEVEEFKRKQADLEHKIAVITDLKDQQTGPVRVMDAVSRALPELLWLDQMEVSAAQIRITGQAFNVNAISNLIENLDRVPEFREPRVGPVRDQGEVYQFTLTVEYSLTPDEPEAEEDGEPGAGDGPARARAAG
ncbi:MAG: PilN domain-containing protein [Acidobacteriota bacterium]